MTTLATLATLADLATAVPAAIVTVAGWTAGRWTGGAV